MRNSKKMQVVLTLGVLVVAGYGGGCASPRAPSRVQRVPAEDDAYYDATAQRSEMILRNLEEGYGTNNPALINPLMTLSTAYFHQEKREMSDSLLDRVWYILEANPDMEVENLRLPTRYGSLPAAAREGDHRDVRTHLFAGTNPNQVDTFGRTALHYAAASGDVDIGTMLIKAGAAVSVRDRRRITVREVAERYEHADFLALIDPANVAELRPRPVRPTAEEPLAVDEDIPAFDDFDEFDEFEQVIPGDEDDMFTEPDEFDDDFFMF